VHGLLLWLLVTIKSPPVVLGDRPTEVTFIEKDRKKSRRFVTETEKEELQEKVKDIADTLSALTKRVKKEMVARENGPTKNSLNLNPTRFDMPRVGGQQKPKGEEPGLVKPSDTNPLRGGLSGSTISEHIPGIDEGYFTALNTDQFTYYAFFSRVNEQVRNRWVSMIRNYMNSLTQEQLQQLARSDRQSVVEIVLSKSGEFIKALLHSSSTVKPLDLAATESFRMAAPFLNPPQGLVEADGFIHLRYGFMVRFKPHFGPGGN